MKAVFEVLSDILRPYAQELYVKHDTDNNFYLEEDSSSGKRQMFAAAQIKKNYVSFHLFPVYCQPHLLEDVPQVLLKRMQGKSCFNFKTVEQIPAEDLKSLVQRAYAAVL